MSNKYIQKLLDHAKKFYSRCNKNYFKRAIQKTAKATGDLTANKNADQSKSSSKKYSKNNLNEANNEIEAPKERYISPEKKTTNKLLMT